MAKAVHILGLNARQKLYKSLNLKKARRIANSKLLTKKCLKGTEVLVPELYAVFGSMDEVREFDFNKIRSSFVIKPSAGSGGKGILIVRKPTKNPGEWVGVDGRILKDDDLKLHTGDILEGQYSTFGVVHRAFVEERVPVHSKFRRYVYKGTPDIRVVVYNRVPVMAMLRLPTKESEGRANLHQGAIGVGVDVATGITLKGVRKDKRVRYVPGTKRKLNGLKIPQWTAVLTAAVKAAEAAELTFGGVDILLHREKGPMVVELNASPGLAIQIANKQGLKWRLERVEGLKIRDVDHGVRVGKALFAEWFADKVKAKDGLVVVGTYESVEVRVSNKKRVEVEAMIDTGAYRSRIDREVVSGMGLLTEDSILWEKGEGGRRRKRQVIDLTYFLKGRRIKTAVSVVNRSRLRRKMVVGRCDLQGFLVNPDVKSSR